MSHLSLIAGVSLLTILEVVGTTLLTHWSRSPNQVWFLVAGLLIFESLGAVLAICIHHVGQTSVVNALWQSVSIFSVTLICSVVYDERLTPLQWAGVVFSIFACLCLLTPNQASSSFLLPEEPPLLLHEGDKQDV